jgi:hypothetical protein
MTKKKSHKLNRAYYIIPGILLKFDKIIKKEKRLRKENLIQGCNLESLGPQSLKVESYLPMYLVHITERQSPNNNIYLEMTENCN